MFSYLPAAALVALSWSSAATAQYLAIQGVTDGVGSDGSRPARLNIDNLQNDPYAWPLYIQALTAMQNTAQTSLTSYFEISGIHGRPYKGWDNVNGPNTDTGYCTHDSVLFPSWHRPYLALFEDQLSTQAKTIASQYNGSDKSKYQAAAQTLRMPFWDWASSPAIPNIVNTALITITTPSGPRKVNNPLYRYTLPALDPTYFPRNAPDGFLARDKTTIRDSNANAALTAAGLTDATYNLFSRITDYSTFATQAISGSSLEAVHGTVHVSVGGNNGHMSQLSYAAFDPIFWLHHCNVDRIFSLWQAIYPDAYIPSQGVQDPYGTYTIAPGSTDYSSTVLTPFTSTVAGDFWNSDTARSLSAWGYTYPEINDWSQTKADLAASVTQQVNALYGSQPGANKRKHARDISPTKGQEWFVDIAVSKFELGSSFSVLIFLGDAPTDSSTWKRATNLAGSLFISTPPYERKEAKLTTHGEIALKRALDIANLLDTSEAGVVDYLTKNLQWRVQKTDGTVVDTSACKSLKITAKVEDVTYPTSEYGFPSYGSPVEHPEITKGKAGGD